MRREQNIGAHRLNTLKEQVHKAEGSTCATARSRRTSDRKACSNRTALRHGESKSEQYVSESRLVCASADEEKRRNDQDASESRVVCSSADAEISKYCRNQLLAFRFAVRVENDHVIVESPAVTSETYKEPDCVLDGQSDSVCEKTRLALQMAHAKPDDTDEGPDHAVCANAAEQASDVVDDWEQLVTLDEGAETGSEVSDVPCVNIDATHCTQEDTPDDWEECANCFDSTPEFAANSVVPTTLDTIPAQHAANEIPTTLDTIRVQHAPKEVDHDAGVDALLAATLLTAKSDASRRGHSRFRKDLINLSKTVLKWIQKEDDGKMTKDQVIETIKASKVVQYLRNLHGIQFREDEFVHNLYMKRNTVLLDKALAPVPELAPALERKSSGARRSRMTRCG